MLPVLLGLLRVARCGPGRSRTRPDALLADKAYSSRAHRELLRRKGTKAVIPERSDQCNNRLRLGSAGGRPVTYDTELYKGRNVVERAYESFKQWHGLATRYDKLAVIFRGAAILPQHHPVAPQPIGRHALGAARGDVRRRCRPRPVRLRQVRGRPR